ncbi:unnamed protein product [Pararhodospirillum photometricum DSM 122]|uniref:Uncharacterized protein n=1 Tax=Pararhodospirillum photometricum DSM 122 TaxID=1150469 RepID=H6SM57_PARPM|nr:unnamed protein product [Pararhodospirillum photometricum DSM 122]
MRQGHAKSRHSCFRQQSRKGINEEGREDLIKKINEHATNVDGK